MTFTKICGDYIYSIYIYIYIHFHGIILKYFHAQTYRIKHGLLHMSNHLWQP
jgi:hypothetical protein